MSHNLNQAYSKDEIGERPWGRWKVLDVGVGYALKKIEIEPGHRLSLQYHLYRSEHWLVVDGEGLVELDNAFVFIKKMSYIHIPMKSVHRVKNIGNIVLVILELQQGNILDEADIIRIEDDYSRVL